ncbi:hypothetical protein LCGC14_1939080 [marine sediment metagenome]|uniref:Uncharacterized protein n=1 Tax=marine sediment metagenome TaxID=412755 RepID=A0A0F9G9B7_9ZZZZ
MDEEVEKIDDTILTKENLKGLPETPVWWEHTSEYEYAHMDMRIFYQVVLPILDAGSSFIGITTLGEDEDDSDFVTKLIEITDKEGKKYIGEKIDELNLKDEDILRISVSSNDKKIKKK